MIGTPGSNATGGAESSGPHMALPGASAAPNVIAHRLLSQATSIPQPASAITTSPTTAYMPHPHPPTTSHSPLRQPVSSSSSPHKALLLCNQHTSPPSHPTDSFTVTVSTRPWAGGPLSNQQPQQAPPPHMHHRLTPRRHPPGRPTSRHTWPPGSAPPQAPCCHRGTALATPAWPPAHAAQE
jgi:hypothetical protein